jgi:subtilase family serine protease
MKIVLKLVAIILLVLISTSMLVSNSANTVRASPFRLHEVAKPPHIILDSSFNPATVFNPAVTPTGGAPFCFSGSLGTILCYPPAFLKKAYDFPSTLTGTGSTIVIVDAFGSPTIARDLADFDGNFSIAAPPSFTILCGPTWTGAATDKCPTPKITDSNAGDELGWAEEITLDVTQAHALAPGAKIILVVANSDYDSDLNAAELAVVNQPSLAGSIMSQSFGEADDLVGCIWFPCNSTSPTPYFDPTIRATYNTIVTNAKANMWTVLASSGDDGANEAYSEVGTGELTPSYPATNPNVLAVGGAQGQPYGGQYGTSNPSVSSFPPGPAGTLTCAAGATCNTGLVVINGGTTGCTTTATRTSGVPTSCSATGYGGEGAWQEAIIDTTRGSTGGGISNDYYAGYPGYGYPAIGSYARPSYQSTLPSTFELANGTSVQSGSGQTVNSGGRATPDVSFNAASEGGVLAYMSPASAISWLGYTAGRWVVFGGTSAASPAWAAIIALVNQAHGSPVGFINNAIYELAQSNLYSKAFHDVNVGNNTDAPYTNYQDCGQFCESGNVTQNGYAAGTGYDLTNGWGTPDVANFVNDIQPFIAPANTMAYSISLVLGWNLISLPLIPANTPINTVLGGLALANEATSVFSYQGSPPSWKFATLSAGKFTGTLTTVQDGLGYWIYMTKADTLWVNGYVITPASSPPTYSLTSSWNLIGFKPEPTVGAETVATYLTSISTKYDSNNVWIYDNTSGTWIRATGTQNIQPGQGLWVYMTSAATLYP